VDADWLRVGETNAEFMGGVPLLKPPYGRLTAIDLNRGEIKWRVPFGDMPSLRKNKALAGVALPEQLGAPGAPGAIVTKGSLVFVGGGDQALHAVDVDTGKDLWHQALPQRTSGTPMTYRTRSGRQFVIVAAGMGETAALFAFALGQTTTSAPAR
jgi:glucose dehydrogenase